ncbi:glycosyltransferase family 4 protein [Tsuneonella sp. YG55]|uniref:Glycosyltransferase family 4 protein n=1 Tax=Tsuneonella litorea TaxID=2976475 RepID=A0A9X2W3T8_9SPHN|nr:glycosyltransferase family 4 protein [Tsuneonella litorea]MCT2560227.1 glycosyltransferase family 4 protein [Tsuneonella litorea]
MRIAQVSPLIESCPPKLYGGTERIVHFLTEELVRQGHEVTLFASGDSCTAAELVSCVPKALRLVDRAGDHLPHHLAMIEQVRRRLDDFDIIHFHIDLLQLPVVQGWDTPTVTTLHGRLDLPGLEDCYRAFADVPLVSISDKQRLPLPPINWAATIYHGLPAQLLPFNAEGGDYLVFLGRISPEKRPDRAIEIAVRSGKSLKMAAKVDHADRAYWEQHIRPMVEAHDNIEFIGEVDEAGKAELVGNAGALLFPIDWPEPFGLVMIEAMSCGTPVIAWRNGSVPEVIDDGISGRIVDSMDAAVAAVDEVLAFSRAVIRSRFDARFTAARMARDYTGIYQKLVDEGARHRRASVAEFPVDAAPTAARLVSGTYETAA